MQKGAPTQPSSDGDDAAALAQLMVKMRTRAAQPAGKCGCDFGSSKQESCPASSAASAASRTACPVASRTAAPVPVQAHAAWFADSAGNLTTESMTKAHASLGITDGVGFKCKAIEALCRSHRCPLTGAGIAAIPNPARTGIWTASGEFDKKRFDELAGMAQQDDRNTCRAVTRAMVDRLVNQGATNTAVWVWLFRFIPVRPSWRDITSASFDELFRNFADTTVAGEPAISVNVLLQFYTDPLGFFSSRSIHSPTLKGLYSDQAAAAAAAAASAAAAAADAGTS